MSKCHKLLQNAKDSPSNVRFADLCKLAECFGWVFKRQKGSHCIYSNPALGNTEGNCMNFQEGSGGKAKIEQVTQLLNAIELHNLE